MEFRILVRQGIIQDLSFDTDGCGSSLACGSMAACLANGKRVQEAAVLRQEDILAALNGFPPESGHCALLAANTLRAACADYFSRLDSPDRTAAPVRYLAGSQESETQSMHPHTKEKRTMRIAIPLADGKLTMHFGHCASFALIDADCAEKKILAREDVDAPPHQPGLLPPWLAERGVNTIIAGGMGQRAQDLFQQHNIQVIVGAPVDTPEKLVLDYLGGSLQPGENVCDH